MNALIDRGECLEPLLDQRECGRRGNVVLLLIARQDILQDGPGAGKGTIESRRTEPVTLTALYSPSVKRTAPAFIERPFAIKPPPAFCRCPASMSMFSDELTASLIGRRSWPNPRP